MHYCPRKALVEAQFSVLALPMALNRDDVRRTPSTLVAEASALTMEDFSRPLALCCVQSDVSIERANR